MNSNSSSTYRIGNWHIRPETLTLNDGVNDHKLRAKVFRVLLELIEANGEVVSREALINKIWNGQEEVGNPNLTNAIWVLRKMLVDEDCAEPIKTIPKKGYQLSLAVETIAKVSKKNAVTATMPSGIFMGLGALLIIVLLAIITVNTFTTEPDALIKTPEFDLPIALTHYSGVEELPDISQDGKQLAFNWIKPNEPVRIFIKDLTEKSTELLQLSSGETSEFNPTFSPDGQQLTFMAIEKNNNCTIVIKSLTTLQNKKLTSCHHLKYQRGIDWSSSGSHIAFPNLTADGNIGLYRINVNTRKVSALTTPDKSSEDGAPVYANNSDKLAFVRSIAESNYLFLLDTQQQETQLTFDGAPIESLGWLPDDRHIIINTFKQGKLNFWKVDSQTGKSEVVTGIPSATTTNFQISKVPESLIYVKYTSRESIKIYDLNDFSKSKFQIRSTGRDMFASYSPYQQKIAFLSSRNSILQLWLSNIDGSDAAPLELEPAIYYYPRLSEDAPLLVVNARAENKSHSELIIYNYQTHEKSIISKDSADYRYPNWIPGENALLVSSDRSGEWEIWRYELSTETFTQITSNGGFFAQQSKDGSLFFTKQEDPKIYQRTSSGEINALPIDLPLKDNSNWVLADSGIYYVLRDNSQDSIQFYDFNQNNSREIAVLPWKTIRIPRSLELIDNKMLAVTELSETEADIMQVKVINQPSSDN